MKTAIKSTLAVAATTAALVGVAAIPSLVKAADWNVRPTYSLEQINDGSWKKGDITFNSIVLKDSDYEWYKNTHDGKPIPQGTLRNETNFVGARVAGTNQGAANVWEGDRISVEDGKTYVVRLYVHNNNPYGEEEGNVAKNTQVRFYVPQTASKNVTVNGWLKADNAREKDGYVDDVTFYNNDTPFHLEYVDGSALLENGNYASGAGVKLTNSIVNQGNPTGNVADEWTKIGYNALDGDVPGCYKYINYVTIEVKAVFDYEYTVEKKARVVGDADRTWKDTVEAKVGDKVEFQIEYKNTSDKTQMGVSIRDVLPSNLRYISGSAKLYNANHPSGATFTHDYLVNQGVNIGGYTAGSNAIIRFQVEVVDDNLACGSNTMVNWGRAGVGTKTIQDYARVHLNKVCENKPDEPTPPTPEQPDEPTPENPETPKELPSTGPEVVAGGVIATGSIVTAAGYYIASRRQLR